MAQGFQGRAVGGCHRRRGCVALALYQHFGLGRAADTGEPQGQPRCVGAGLPERSRCSHWACSSRATCGNGALHSRRLRLDAGRRRPVRPGVGLLVVSFASSLGALLAFLAARYLLRDTIQQSRFGNALAPINDGVRKDGTFTC
jgi:hypothetical protein